MSTTKCTQRCSTKHMCFILGRSNIRFPQSEIEFEKLCSFFKSTQANPVHYPTAANSSTLSPRYITSQQETLALCHPATLPHSSQLPHFATPLHYPTADNSRTLQPHYITPHKPTFALCHSFQPNILDNSTTTNSSVPNLYT
jgi:hypothetical protein